MMRWCISTARYAPSTGGVERFCEELAAELAREGNDVLVLAGDADGTVERLGANPRVLCVPSLGLAGGRMPVPVPGGRLAKAMREAVSWGCDAMLVNTRLYPQSLLALEVARRTGAPAVVLDHGSGHVPVGSFALNLAEHAWEHAIALVTKAYRPAFCGISERSATWLGHYGVVPTGVIHNAIDVEEFLASASGRDFRSELGLADRELLVAFSGRLVSGKGADLVVRTAEECHGRGIPARFVIAGDGPLRGPLETSACPGCSFLGSLDKPDVAALLTQADVLLFPSSYPEGMPTTLLEAAACEAVIVTTDVAGAREIVPDDAHGIVLEEADPSVMAEIVTWYCENPQVMREQARRCREHVSRRFTWRHTADELRAVVGA